MAVEVDVAVIGDAGIGELCDIGVGSQRPGGGGVQRHIHRAEGGRYSRAALMALDVSAGSTRPV